ncbi:hypothetical protein GCM10025867_46900 (plasmid) [Frondihabitans sucicola]|uniref:DUF222 domain-containing protein n=1 Tax=Frondihabitans sucicola TaxID=1268041 RepID=A0ABN6Y5V6_9MICO|nr:hypothetical protein [Frondihabitans sucicola]BDZ52449.1 hypothetical protein GCM10025867_46900 [Frondihabitans sucicola]
MTDVLTDRDIRQNMAAPADSLDLADIDIEEAKERAENRLAQLTRSFALLLQIVAQMYEDQDWRYLTRPDGTAYGSLAQVLAEELKKSPAMARRYVQGARELYLPLSKITVDGVDIDIDSHDVQDLGIEGSREVVSRVTDRIDGVDDPDDQAAIIRDTVSEVRAAREGRLVDPIFGDEDDETPGDLYTGNDGIPRYCGKDVHGDPCFLSPGHKGECDADPDGAPLPPEPMSFTGDIILPDSEQAPAGLVDETVDPVEALIASGADYTDETARAGLPADLVPIVEALVTLSRMDAGEFARAVSFDNRGIAALLPKATGNLIRSRSLIETQPWVLSRM